MFTDITDEIKWTAQQDRKEVTVARASDEIAAAVLDWYRALCDHSFLRGGADKAMSGAESSACGVPFRLKGLEWLKKGLGVGLVEVISTLGELSGIKSCVPAGGRWSLQYCPCLLPSREAELPAPFRISARCLDRRR